MSKRDKDRANRAVDAAIDRMITLQELGLGCDTVSRILEQLNTLSNRIQRLTYGDSK